MANHKSALKRIRSNDKKRLRNRFQHKTTRNAVKKLKELTDRKEADVLLKSVISMLDKLSKRNIIHANKAANLKSKLTKHVSTLQKSKNNQKKSATIRQCFFLSQFIR